MNTSPCRGCGRPVIWAITENGKRMPVDPDPVPGGNVELVQVSDRTHAIVRTTPSKFAGLRMPHHATCPNVADFRKVKASN